MSLISFDKVYEVLYESVKIAPNKNANSIVNKFKLRPQGVIITDSYNNPFLPITPKPRLDTSALELPEVFRRYRELYSTIDTNFLPWHYCIELVDSRYYIFNTRPINMKFPLTNGDVDDINWKEDTRKFISNNVFNISDFIHICIIGDSSLDVYTKHFYEILTRTCILPILTIQKLPGDINERIFPLNLGKRFNINNITKFIRK